MLSDYNKRTGIPKATKVRRCNSASSHQLILELQAW
jgi:hypothetical protein